MYKMMLGMLLSYLKDVRHTATLILIDGYSTCALHVLPPITIAFESALDEQAQSNCRNGGRLTASGLRRF
jgi:hypothetical protein